VLSPDKGGFCVVRRELMAAGNCAVSNCGLFPNLKVSLRIPSKVGNYFGARPHWWRSLDYDYDSPKFLLRLFYPEQQYWQEESAGDSAHSVTTNTSSVTESNGLGMTCALILTPD
jgi:hypothetical protein